MKNSARAVLISLGLASSVAMPGSAGAAVYCTYVGYPVGCVVRPGVVLRLRPVVVAPAPVVVAPGPVIATPGVGAPGVGVAPGVSAPGVGVAGTQTNRGGPVDRVGRR